MDVLSPRALNRATLARQMLLERHDVTVQEAVEQTVGLNAQSPNEPYLWLWSRLTEFTVSDLTDAIVDRSIVRSTLMRGTQHFVAAHDFVWLRPVLQQLLNRIQRNTFGRRVGNADLERLTATTRKLMAGEAMTRSDLSRLLDRQFPDAERGALGWSAQFLEPMLHPAPSGTWNTLGATPFVLATDWLGPLGAPDADQLVRRYLAAYGPATASDVRAWSGVAGLREVVDRMRPELFVFRDETGREVFDLPDAPRPDPDTPAPIRFLPELDNVLLAYSDRTRMMTDEIRAQVCQGDAVWATVLVDGVVRAKWSIDDATIVIHPFGALTKAERAAVDDERDRLQHFLQSAEGADLV